MRYNLNCHQRKLIEDHYPLLRKYIKNAVYKHHIPSYLIDDFISDSHLKFCISALRYDGSHGKKFSSYVYQGVDFCVKNVFDRRRKEATSVVLLPEKEIEDIIDSLLNERFEINVDYLLKVIDECSLKPKNKKILFLYYFEDKTLSSIANKYHMTKEGIRFIINSSLNKIKEYLKHQDVCREDFFVKGNNINGASL